VIDRLDTVATKQALLAKPRKKESFETKNTPKFLVPTHRFARC